MGCTGIHEIITCTHINTHVPTSTHIPALAHTYTYAYAYTHGDTDSHKYTHTLTCNQTLWRVMERATLQKNEVNVTGAKPHMSSWAGLPRKCHLSCKTHCLRPLVTHWVRNWISRVANSALYQDKLNRIENIRQQHTYSKDERDFGKTYSGTMFIYVWMYLLGCSITCLSFRRWPSKHFGKPLHWGLFQF